MSEELTHIFKQISDNLVRIADALEESNTMKKEEQQFEKLKAIRESKKQKMLGHRS